MATLETRIKQLQSALIRFNEAIEEYNAIDFSEKNKSYLNDSVIQRFEFCVDLFWKCLKDYIAVEHKLIVASPKSTMQESFNQKIITAQELELFAAMVDDRNNTSHRYDQTMASEIAERASRYHNFMEKIVTTKLKIKNATAAID